MRTNAEAALRQPWCVLFTAGIIFTIAPCELNAQEQGSAQKPPEVYQALYLSNSTGQQDANDVQTALRNMLPRSRIYYANTSNALLIRGSAEDVAAAQKIVDDLDKPRKTYRLTFTIGDGSTNRHFVLVVTSGERSELKQGSRVPIMTGSYGDSKQEHNEIQYVDVGMSVQATLTGLGEGLRLRSKIEQTSVADEKSNVGIQDPVIRQSVLEDDTALSPGKQATLGSMEMLDGGKKVEVSVTAELVK
jgi:type II secretory pathway component GspD/PulD (secretin)